MKVRYLMAAVLLLGMIQSCRKDKSAEANKSNYPEQVGNIINTKNAISGCHNQKSKSAAGGLSMETWGAVV